MPTKKGKTTEIVEISFATTKGRVDVPREKLDDVTSKMSRGPLWLLLPVEGPPVPKTYDVGDAGLDMALTAVAKHLRDSSAAAHRERIDLAALHAHTGERYAQVEIVPNELCARLRELHGVKPMVLLPPNANGGSTTAGKDAVVLFADPYGPIKGLPANKKATMLLSACGVKEELRGECFIARLRPASASAA